MTATRFADELRDYVLTHGPRATLLVIALILEDSAAAAKHRPDAIVPTVNAEMIRQAMERMV